MCKGARHLQCSRWQMLFWWRRYGEHPHTLLGNMTSTPTPTPPAVAELMAATPPEPAQTGAETYRAMFDFAKEGENRCLVFAKGAEIVVMRKEVEEGAGWWEGCTTHDGHVRCTSNAHPAR